MKKLRAAVIGVGYLGRFHAQKYKNNHHCELVGVCDSNKDQAQKVATELKVQHYTQPSDLLSKVDLVTIAASTTFHYELAALFLQEGIAVNVEKPMTATYEQAEKLYELHQKKNVLLNVGHIERFNPAIRELKKIMGQDVQTDVQAMELTRFATFKNRGSDVSVIYDLMIHDLDLLFWLTNSEVSNFWCCGQKLVSTALDSVQASFEMKNLQKVYISVSRVSSKMERSIKTYSASKNMLANSATLELELQKWNQNSTNPDEKVSNELIQLDKVDALQEETNHFIECVLGNQKSLVTGEDGLRAMKWAKIVSEQIEKN